MSHRTNPIKRRRGSAFLTKNACTECKMKRAKASCDGQSPCARCVAHGRGKCHYEVSVRVSKNIMKAEIEELRTYRQMSESVLGLLVSGDRSDLIVRQLRNGRGVEDIYKTLEGEAALLQTSSNDSSAWDRELSAKSSKRGSWVSDLGSRTGRSQEDPHSHDGDGVVEQEVGEEHSPGNHTEPWTAVTSDDALIEHLLSLYFCWEYPIFASLCRQHFLTDFRTVRRRYCSSLLVNAVLAVGSLFSSQSGEGTDLDNSEGSGQQFFCEAERLWASDYGSPSLTTIQALGLMSIFEASRGRDKQSMFHAGQSIRMAVEMGLHYNTNDAEASETEREVRSATIWGTFALDNAWSLIVGRVPHLSRIGVRTAKPAILGTEEHTEWRPYIGYGTSVGNSLLQMSNARSVSVAICELFEVVHDSLYVLYMPGRLLSQRDILDIYTRYLSWYSAPPTALRLGENSTPSVLFMHMYHHFAVLLLFGPFIKLRFLDSTVFPYEICIQAANAITSLLDSYRRLYSVRRTPCFVPLLALASNSMHVIRAETLPLSASPLILQGVADLREMAFSHRSAARGAKNLEAIGQRHCLPVSLPGNEAYTEDPDDLNRHFKTSMNLFHSDVESFQHASDIAPRQSIFSPFPSQVLPLPAFEKQLKMAGFELVSRGP
ncbi:fungal-specific transcription factor domain-containing protein [Halenospora varia]|nr:fungal-specific transcription factor domain-containing protein [Halenospora varia]